MFRQYDLTFWKLFFIATILMIGLAYYQGTVVLYLLTQFHFKPNLAYEINGVFSAILYLCPIFSGWLTKKWGQPKTGITYGLFLYATGAFISMFPDANLYLTGLAFSALGYGLVYINTFFLIGRLYDLNDPRRESSFTLVYIALNIGALIGFTYGGHVVSSNHTHLIVLVFGLFFLSVSGISMYLMKSFLNTNGEKENWLAILFVSLLFIFMTVIALLIANRIQTFLSILCFALLFAIFYLGMKEYRLNQLAGKKILLLGVLTLFSVIFWTCYKIQDSFVLVFIQQHSVHNVLGYQISAPSLLSINPVVIILAGPLVSLFWLKSQNKYNNPLTKIALSLFILGLAFLSLYVGVQIHFPTYLVWIILFFSIVAISEIIFGPGSVSIVGQLAGEKYQMVLIGLTQLSLSSASIFSAQLSIWFQKSLTDNYFIQIAYTNIYRNITLLLIITSILILLYKKFLVK